MSYIDKLQIKFYQSLGFNNLFNLSKHNNLYKEFINLNTDEFDNFDLLGYKLMLCFEFPLKHIVNVHYLKVMRKKLLEEQ